MKKFTILLVFVLLSTTIFSQIKKTMAFDRVETRTSSTKELYNVRTITVTDSTITFEGLGEEGNSVVDVLLITKTKDGPLFLDKKTYTYYLYVEDNQGKKLLQRYPDGREKIYYWSKSIE